MKLSFSVEGCMSGWWRREERKEVIINHGWTGADRGWDGVCDRQSTGRSFRTEFCLLIWVEVISMFTFWFFIKLYTYFLYLCSLLFSHIKMVCLFSLPAPDSFSTPALTNLEPGRQLAADFWVLNSAQFPILLFLDSLLIIQRINQNGLLCCRNKQPEISIA